MCKHGISHGLAVLACTISSALVVDLVRTHIKPVHAYMNHACTFVAATLPIPVAPDHLHVLLYATLLGTAWGAAFSLMHRDKIV